jgi:hypothetical protein
MNTAAVTLVNERLFELMPNGTVYGYNAKTGRVFTNGDFDPKPWNLRWEGFQPPTDVKDAERRKLNAAQSPHDLAGYEAGGLPRAAPLLAEEHQPPASSPAIPAHQAPDSHVSRARKTRLTFRDPRNPPFLAPFYPQNGLGASARAGRPLKC